MATDPMETANRAAKAMRILDALDLVAGDVKPTGDVVRAMSDEGWTRAEQLAGVKHASVSTREVVAKLADLRRELERDDVDPFDLFG